MTLTGKAQNLDVDDKSLKFYFIPTDIVTYATSSTDRSGFPGVGIGSDGIRIWHISEQYYIRPVCVLEETISVNNDVEAYFKGNSMDYSMDGSCYKAENGNVYEISSGHFYVHPTLAFGNDFRLFGYCADMVNIFECTVNGKTVEDLSSGFDNSGYNTFLFKNVQTEGTITFTVEDFSPHPHP